MYTYPEYYKAAMTAYGGDIHGFYKKGVFHPGAFGAVLLNTEEEFNQLVEHVAGQVAKKIPSHGKADKSGLLIDFSDIFSLDGVEKLGDFIVPPLEKDLYGCNLYVDKIYSYRNVYCEKRSASWLWHWDNNPDEIFKIIIYLTDVGRDEGPFEFMVDENGDPVMKHSTRTGHDNWNKPPNGSRVLANEIKSIKDKGGKSVRVTGKRGTVIVFNNNIVHRANVPAKGKTRDIMTLRVRPTLEPMQPYIDPKWTTTSTMTGAVTVDPEIKRQTKCKQ